MTTAVISDLHLGITTEADVARRPEALERLAAAVEGADRLVLLGDLLELREHPLRAVLEVARPVVERLGAATAGRQVVLVPGNHDYQFAEPWLQGLRLDGAELRLEHRWAVGPGDGAAGRLAAWMPDSEVLLAYPGLWLRDDVYATHGHYLDFHLTVPRLESLAASAMGRLTGRLGACRSPADYEAILAPLYGFFYGLAQGGSGALMDRGGRLSRSVWGAASSDGGRRLSRLLLGRVTIPGAVAILNRARIGRFTPDLSGGALRRAGLRAMAEVVACLGVEAEHVVFGHTHRAGPLPGDALEEWRLPGGRRLWNSGAWLREDVFLRERGARSPYWPGTVLNVPDEGPPELENVLEDVPLLSGRRS